MSLMSIATPAPAEMIRPPLLAGLGDRLFRGLCLASGLLVVGLAVALVVVLTYEAWPTLTHLHEYRLFTSDVWNPDTRPPEFGTLTFIYGTLASSLIAMLIAVPLGV